jgi:Tfp pilus assembly protein PilX
MRGEKRKIVVKRLIRDEKGQALVMVMILLLIGGLITAPLLSSVGTGLSTAEVYEMRTVELYAADAGVEDAVWKIQNSDGYLPCSPTSPPKNYTITDVNGKSVAVNITSEYAVGGMTFTYRVVSTSTGDGSGTEIEAYIVGVSKYGDYAGLLGQVLTSQGEIELSPGTNITPLEGEHAPIEYYEDAWPTAAELAEFYLDDVAGAEPYDSDTLDIDGVDTEIGPFYRDGELDILNTSNDPATLTLTGTVYVTGDTLIGKNGKDMTIDLNGHTLFVASSSADPQKALWIGGQCTAIGSGIIIAIGDIYFEPKTEAGVTDPIFIMSCDGTTTLQPAGDFYGSIAGSVEIDLQPNTSVNYPVGEDWYENLNFLIGVQELIFHIFSWEVIPLSPE